RRARTHLRPIPTPARPHHHRRTRPRPGHRPRLHPSHGRHDHLDRNPRRRTDHDHHGSNRGPSTRRPAMIRVLVVDDDRQLLRALRITLSARGYDVTTATDGATALAAASLTPPDLII